MKSMLRLSSRCSSCSSSSTAACTETSSAEVTSSQISRSGSAASARAIATRWRSPPESSTGKRSPRRLGSRTRSSNSPTRVSASPRDRPLSTRRGRAIERRTRCRGLSDSNGFWNTIWIRRRTSQRAVAGVGGSASRRRRRCCSGRPVQPRDAAPDRRLAAARLADERHAATGLDRERDVHDGRPDGAAAAVARLQRRHLEQGSGRWGLGTRPNELAGRADRASSCARQQRTACPGAASASTAPPRGSDRRRARNAERRSIRRATRPRRRRRPGCPAANAGGGSRGSPRPARACRDAAAAR